MLIVGAGGLASQVVDDLMELKKTDIVFWSELQTKYKFIEEMFPMISTDAEVINYFANVSSEFILCISNDKSDGRRKMAERFKRMGGIITSFISPFSRVSPYSSILGKGTLIVGDVVIEPGVIVGEGTIINRFCGIGHGCIIGNYCEIGPGVLMAGEVEINDACFIGMGAIIHPKIKIGRNVTVAAGSVVTKNIPDNTVVAGVPAEIKFKKKNAN
jgi:sugar O-acyltransferase (sialic acid O-acetyltransferase NeuD family)